MKRWIAVLLVLGGCSQNKATTETINPPGDTVALMPHSELAPVSFVNRVWQVAESKEVEPGQLYVFLSESTLVMASPHGKPAFGSWSYDGKNFRMVEEGVSYDVDIVSLTADEFRIRSHNPGGTVEMRLVPAEEAGVARPAP